MAFNQILNTAKGVLGQAARAGQGAANQGIALGKRFANRNPEPKAGMDDVTLARKVETELFRDSKTLKGKIDINAVDGTVWLRGEVKNPAQSKAVEAKVRSIPEVQDVENLLHLPKTPAPTRKKGTPASKREKKAQPRRFDKTPTDDHADEIAPTAEPAPAEVAREGSGRKPAPLGASDGPSTSPTGGTTPSTGSGS
jgi:BON domain